MLYQYYFLFFLSSVCNKSCQGSRLDNQPGYASFSNTGWAFIFHQQTGGKFMLQLPKVIIVHNVRLSCYSELDHLVTQAKMESGAMFDDLVST